MKICIAVNSFFSFKKHRINLARALKAKGHEVIVVLPSSDRLEIKDTDFHYEYIRVSRKGTNPFSELLAIAAFIRVYAKHRPLLVHHFTIKFVIYGTIAAIVTRVRSIVNSITGLGYIYAGDSRKQKLLRILTNNLYRFVFLPDGVQVIFQNPDDYDLFITNRIVPKDRANLILGSGVDTDKFYPQSSPHSGPVRFYFISRMLRSKGIDELIDAARVLRSKNVAFELHFVGTPDPGNPESVSAEELEEAVSDGLLQFHGYKEDIPAILCHADVVVLPTWYREGIPMSLLEAMACGKTIITTDMPGCREIVRGNGFLVPPRSVPDLAGALEECVLKQDMLADWGRKSLALARKEFSKPVILDQMLSLYQKCFAKAGM